MNKHPKKLSFAKLVHRNDAVLWQELEQSEKVSLISIDTLHKILINQGPWEWSAMAHTMDPLFAWAQSAVQNENLEILGGITLGKTTILWLLNPDDGYRSFAESALVVPRTCLKTALPDLPLLFEVRQGPDAEKNPDKNDPFIIKGMSEENTTLFEVGTLIYDSYYPHAVATFDTKEIDRISRVTTKKILKKHLAPTFAQKQQQTKRKL